MKIGFIGLGNMSTAIIEGLKNSQSFNLENIYASSRNNEKLIEKANTLKINYLLSNQTLVDEVDIIFLGVKPEDLLTLNLDFKDKIVVSMVAKTTIKTIETIFNVKKIVRIMPNINVAINQGSIAYTSINLNENTNQNIINLLKLIGKVWQIEEDKFSGFTALAGSSPALIFRFINEISQVTISEGFTNDEALEIFSFTALASIKYLISKDLPIEKLIEAITSKKGTTEAGLKVLDEYNFDEIIFKAIQAIIEKDKKGNS